MGKRKTLSVKGALLSVEPKRIEKKKYKNGSTSTIMVFDCLGDCGSEVKLNSSTHLKTHSGKCRSCVQRGLPFEASFNELYNRENKHHREVTITYEEYYELCREDVCHYCLESLGRQPYTKKDGKDVANSRGYMLDRKDNERGYHIDNVVNCCWKCNSGKGARYSYEEWYGMTKYFRDLKNEIK